jgi:hypothetical protein
VTNNWKSNNKYHKKSVKMGFAIVNTNFSLPIAYSITNKIQFKPKNNAHPRKVVIEKDPNDRSPLFA